MDKSYKFLVIACSLMLLLSSCRPVDKIEDAEVPTQITPTTTEQSLPLTPEPMPTPSETAIEIATATQIASKPTDLSRLFSGGQCEGVGPVRLDAAPANPDQLAHIFHLGLMSGSHVTPVDHQYYYWNDLNVALERYPIYSPGDGYVVNIQFLENDYIVFIEHSCAVYTEFIHLEKLVGPLAEFEGQVSWGKPLYIRVLVRAGEIIAYDGGTNGFDFSVFDADVTLPGFINPASYQAEPWKIHTVDPYDYFDEPVRGQLLAKNVRQVEPLGGKIDHDIPGRLIGNWFVEGTNGYAGISNPSQPIKPDQQLGYWNTHLAIAPDPIDPSAVIISLGLFEGQTAQLAVVDPYPLPEDVTVETGLVKYILADWMYVHSTNGEQWFGVTRQAASDIAVQLGMQIRGTVLFQLLDDDHLMMETFPGIDQVEGLEFSEAAIIYER